MENINFEAPKAANPVGPYPHSKKVGPFLFLSGIGPRRKRLSSFPGLSCDSTHTIPTTIEEQFESVIENLKYILESSSAALSNIVDVTIFLTNMKEDFAIVNKLYGKYFNAQTGPTRTTVEVNALPTPIKVELKCIAYLND